MLALSLLLTTAAPAASVPQAVRNDLQCMAIYAIAAGSEGEADVKEVGALGMVYYLGKIEAAMPGLDVGPAFRDEVLALEAGENTDAGDRCGKDFEATGKRLITIGEIVTQAEGADAK